MRSKIRISNTGWERLADFFFELGLQKIVKRTGWWVAGVKDPETIGEHSHRTALLAYIIAKLENADAMKCACMAMIHDIPETRINDSHKIAVKYLNCNAAEPNAFHDQTQALPPGLRSDLADIFKEFNERKTKEANIAKDADHLECAFQAREYLDLGYASTKFWIKNVENTLASISAKRILSAIEERNSKDWYQGLSVNRSIDRSVNSSTADGLDKSSDNKSRDDIFVRIADFIYEMGLLKLVKRSGPYYLGVKEPETVSEHIQRASLIAYAISFIEGGNPHKAACISMLHDIPEARINDLSKLAQSYLKTDEAEMMAFRDQISLLPISISRDFNALLDEYINASTKEGIIARDCDRLECEFQAKTYLDEGINAAGIWLKKGGQGLRTESAMRLSASLLKRDSKKWFSGLNI